MNGAELDLVRTRALALGYLLRPIPPKARETAALVAKGAKTSRRLADREGLKIAAAHNRLRTAERLGLIEESDLEPLAGGGFETVWRAVD